MHTQILPEKEQLSLIPTMVSKAAGLALKPNLWISSFPCEQSKTWPAADVFVRTRMRFESKCDSALGCEAEYWN